MVSRLKTKKHLNFKALSTSMAEHFSAIDDNRQQNKCDYSQHDILMSAFSCMFFQDPSLLHFQKRLEQDQQRNNLRNIFNVQNIPSNNQLCDVLDEISSEALAPIFKGFYEKLRRHKHLEGYAILPNVLMCAIRRQLAWQNDVPLNGKEKTINVNWFQYQFKNIHGKITKTHRWVTDIKMNEDNVTAMTKAGRCRWKIENECFNTLKNQGYHIEHNYGHGDKNLSDNMYLLTLLAFYFHQIFELTDGVYQACRVSFGSKSHLWENFRASIRMLVVEDWAHLMDLLLNPDNDEVTATKNS